MDFYDWLIERQLRKDGTFRNSRFGDLALDMSADKAFPRDATKDRILDYLRSRYACREALQTFKDAWRSYQKAGGLDA